MKQQLPISDLGRIYQPGSLLVMSTSHKGQDNVMALAWHTLCDSDELQISCIMRRGCKSLTALKESGECVLNVPLDEQLEQVLLCGSHSGHVVDKLALCGWSLTSSTLVQVPSVRECYAHIECRLTDVSIMGGYKLCLLRPVSLWLDQHEQIKDFMLPALRRSRLHLHGNQVLLPAQQRQQRFHA